MLVFILSCKLVMRYAGGANIEKKKKQIAENRLNEILK